jgi:hypothetical protein
MASTSGVRSAGVLFARPLVGSRWTADQGPLAQKTPTLLNHSGQDPRLLLGSGQLVDHVDDSGNVAGDR